MPASIHAKCKTVAMVDGSHVICGKSPEHCGSKDPARREHFDPSADKRWTDEEHPPLNKRRRRN